MTVVRAVEPAIDDIVVMVVVWNPGMAAVLTMFMVAQLGRAPLWVGLRHGDLVVVDVVDVEVMHMSVVEIIDVRGVTNGEMSTIRRVLVAMLPMRAVRHIRAADQHATASKQHQKQHPIKTLKHTTKLKICFHIEPRWNTFCIKHQPETDFRANMLNITKHHYRLCAVKVSHLREHIF